MTIVDTTTRAATPGPIRPERPALAAVKRGFRRLCPACGEGPLFVGYLKSADRCTTCGEEFFHHRADDFPQYVTIFIVAHALVATMLAVDEFWPDLPLTVHYLLWPTLVVGLSLLLLPRVKGSLIAYQWALRMHGFEAPAGQPASAGVITDKAMI